MRNSTAARKAFVVNRIGDAGLLIGFGLIFWTFGSLQFDAVFAGAATLEVGGSVAVGIALCLLLGAIGKSAQIPLFVWLPDAMAGPTPVSALIHAATMVTAGVFLIVRSGALFALAPVIQSLIVLLGALTALLGATAAVAQNDIKRTLAYSTISQLGFMMVAVGMGDYTAGMFHLITHAFFKALLFLSAGSVVHAMEHALHALPSHSHHRKARSGDSPPAAQDMRLMGGLRTRMPLTFWAYTFGALALAGVPPLAGFFSKDAILGYASEHNAWAFLALAISAGLTAFYIGRQWFTVFFGESRSRAAETTHESPAIMTRPLLILAALCVLGGALNLPGVATLSHWLGEEEEAFHLSIAAISVALAALGLALAWLLYGRRPLTRSDVDPLEANARGLMSTLRSAWGIDDLVHRTVMRAFDLLGLRLARGDVSVFDGVDRFVVDGARRVAAASEKTQTGQLNWNMAGLLGGAIVVFAIVVVASAQWIGAR
ncbi:MAG: NADH-quinone oxidoreductase subunit L [Chloroflexi bacterium]|nr:NADH-quinone oxidoreductase subunit L [Chloroflexota bacterium]